MDNLKTVIVYFIKHFPRPLTRTELVKLIYLFEYNNMRTFGRQYTGVNFIRDHYGPMDMQIKDACDELLYCDTITIDAFPTPYGEIGYYHRLGDNAALWQHKLPLRHMCMADDIINITRAMNLKQILDYAYSTPPMKELLAIEKGEKLFGREIDMKKSDAEIFKATKEQLASARSQRHERPEKGSREEYNTHLLNTNKDYEDLRRKANLCLK